MSIETLPKPKQPTESEVRQAAEDAVMANAPAQVFASKSGFESSKNHWLKKAAAAGEQAVVDAGFKPPLQNEKDYSLELQTKPVPIDPDVAEVYVKDINDKAIFSLIDEVDRGSRSADGQAIVEFDYNGDGIDKFHGRSHGSGDAKL